MVKALIVDYAAGNLFSIIKAFKYIGIDPIVSNNPKDWEKADLLVFPGQGNFSQAMLNLRNEEKDAIFRELLRKKPFLGICLGMQILFEESEEAPGVPGFGLFKGKVKKIPVNKIPHLGWNEVDLKRESTFFKNIPNRSFFYFVHSYYVDTKEDIIYGFTEYGIAFPSFIVKDNIIGVQFHPEKSSDKGVKFLSNVLEEIQKC
ncbi:MULTISPECIES: imidazole glycerol phosphate synthase subunit HisH [Dictyoglomus]|jgi:glutamine amidotransferase|uniref:Imidazole glycerol phosphate synthase subunit HisH n=1 Tax=Dictyoglomus turgidum (strain DSM 6724 / Z-1310) TaxID=515635 RepID=B8E2C6_DICTD|nr:MULTISPECIES: imidazole glycerol phosphate synthase subunit HisH [Dictyoglomus]ACK42403.1 imidazole glycerol phosphate synthase, glutamine amidotransferase subunit [Dictyoglomus turgidum DSM 6724]PNV80722.1 MAG: imidazole glycerol phosphate synthase subunit HisH [Dictyoglomus turgidum]HBU32141.1 imidazole glycerol phosphate synthase subunit HisH [Dictyoglomus sp.]